MSPFRSLVTRLSTSAIAIGLILMSACSGGVSGQTTPTSSTASSIGSAQVPTSSPTPGIVSTPADGFLVKKFDVSNPQGFADGFGSVWVPGHRDDTISRIDPKTNKVVAVIQGVGYQAQDVAVGDGSVWVPASGATYMARIDPSTNRVVSKLQIGAASDLEFGFGSLWVATKDMRLLRIDPATERVIAKLQIGPKGSNDCNNGPLVTAQWVWVSVCDTGMLIQIDPATNRIARRVDITASLGGDAPGQNAVSSPNAIWVSIGSPSLVARLDPGSGEVVRRRTVDPSRVYGGFMALDGATLWLGGDGILTALDATSLKVTSTYQVVAAGEVDPGVAFGSVWGLVFDYSEVTRYDFPRSA